jgi:hypothetical protein
MRQKLGPRKVHKLREQTGLPVVHVWVRGGTDHRRDLGLEDGSIIEMHKDGTLHPSPIRWRTDTQAPPQGQP